MLKKKSRQDLWLIIAEAIFSPSLQSIVMGLRLEQILVIKSFVNFKGVKSSTHCYYD